MSKMDWLKAVLRFAPMILAETPLAPIALPITAAIQEAEELHGDGNGTAKLAHVINIAEDAAAVVNQQAGHTVVHGDQIGAATASIVGAIVSVANVAGKDPRFLGPPDVAPAPEFIGPPVVKP